MNTAFLKSISLFIVLLITHSISSSRHLEKSCLNSKYVFEEKFRIIISGFSHFNELSFNCNETIKVLVFQLMPGRPLILDDSLKLNSLTLMPIEKVITILFRNFKGFEVQSEPFKNLIINPSSYESVWFMLEKSDFNFYLKENLISPDQCNSTLPVHFLSKWKIFIMDRTVEFSNEICPYVFKNADLLVLGIERISNALTSTNKFIFQDVKIDQKKLNSTIFQLHADFYHSELNSRVLNAVFINLISLNINGVLDSIQSDVFKQFKQLRVLKFKSQNIKNIFVKNNKWLQYLNSGASGFVAKRPLVLVVHQVLPKITFYEYPNEDICFFRQFPHQNLVFPYLSPFDHGECTCTLLYLIQSAVRFNKHDMNDYIELGFNQYYFEYFYSLDELSTSANFKCFNQFFYDLLLNCNLSGMFSMCILNETKHGSGSGSYFYIYDWAELSRISNFILSNYITIIFSVTSILVNILMILVLSSKYIKEKMYIYLKVHSVFNLMFSCVSILRFMINNCSADIFCSKVYQPIYTQYLVLIFVKLFGNSIQTCAAISYCSFTLARYIKVSNLKNETINKLNKIHRKLYVPIVIMISLVINLFIYFEYAIKDPESKINTYEMGTIIEIDFSSNYHRQDPTDYHKENYNQNEYLLLSIFQYIKIVFSDLFFITISLIVDIFLFYFVKKQMKKKKIILNVNSSKNLSTENRISRIVILNGLNVFFLRFPSALFNIYVLIYYYDMKTKSYRPNIAGYLICRTFKLCESVEKLFSNVFLISFLGEFLIFFKLDNNFKAVVFSLTKKFKTIFKSSKCNQS